MTTKDKTGDRLVASIRRTRAATGRAAEEPAAAKAPPAKKAKAPAKKSAAKTSSPKNTRTSGDNYQAGGRVWPD